MTIRSETQLSAPVKHFFESLGYVVKSEVHSCDLVAFKTDQEAPVIIELKKTFNLPLVYQGIERLGVSDQVYLAVERKDDLRRKTTKKWKDAIKLCRMLGLGLLTVRFYSSRKPRVDVLCDPGPYSPKKSKRKSIRLMHEFHARSQDFNVGGSTQTKLVTAYREKALECAYWLQEKGSLRPRDLRELVEYPNVGRMLLDNYYGWFHREERGIYELTPQGEQALKQYKHVIGEKFPDT